MAGHRASRPHDFLSAGSLPTAPVECPFCLGREHETPPPVAIYPASDAGRAADWQVRVVPNLYPGFVRQSRQQRTPTASVGYHEVVIESPQHARSLTELSEVHVQQVFRAYRDRFLEFSRDERMRYALAFKNNGVEAGMSREHVHSQLIALPYLPPLVRHKLKRMRRFFRLWNRCLLCHLLHRELAAAQRVVLQTDNFIAYCPFASRTAYETWIVPRKHQAAFECSPEGLLDEVAALVRKVLIRLERATGGAAYNYMLNTNPFDTCRKDHYHWHIEIIPRLSKLAGLEWGTGIPINIIPPETAAGELRRSGSKHK